MKRLKEGALTMVIDVVDLLANLNRDTGVQVATN